VESTLLTAAIWVGLVLLASEKALVTAVDLAAHYHADLRASGVAELPKDELRQAAEGRFREIEEAAVHTATRASPAFSWAASAIVSVNMAQVP
jgi:predicted RecA/RadA family phage recombinase